MTVLTSFPNGGSFKDYRDTLNQMLADIAALKQAAQQPTSGTGEAQPSGTSLDFTDPNNSPNAL